MAQPDFSIADVLKWARTKPADGGYYYGDCNDCALCHFLIDTGRSKAPQVSPYLSPEDSTAGWRHEGQDYSERRHYPYVLEDALATAHTYGELADLLEAILPAEPISDTWTKADAYLTDVEAVQS